MAVCVNPFAQGDALHRGLGHPFAQGWADVSGVVLGTWQLHKAGRARNTSLCTFSVRPCAPRVSVKRHLRSINVQQNLRKAYIKHNTNKTSKPSLSLYNIYIYIISLIPCLEKYILVGPPLTELEVARERWVVVRGSVGGSGVVFFSCVCTDCLNIRMTYFRSGFSFFPLSQKLCLCLVRGATILDKVKN